MVLCRVQGTISCFRNVHYNACRARNGCEFTEDGKILKKGHVKSFSTRYTVQDTVQKYGTI